MRAVRRPCSYWIRTASGAGLSKRPAARVMRLAIGTGKHRGSRRRMEAGFTLAEVLAALLFLAIVIPTAVEVLHVASLAGEVAARKSEAARVADRVLSESIVTTNWSGRQGGTISEGILDFRWTVTSQNW